MIVALSRSEIDEAVALGKARHAIHEGRENVKLVARGRDNESFRIDGTLAEFAVAKATGVEVSRLNRREGDFGYDLIARNGKTKVDVKSTRTQPPTLFFRTLEAFKADVAVLVSIRSSATYSTVSTEIIGWISRDWFSMISEIQDRGYGPSYTVPPWRLAKLGEKERHEK